MFGRIYPWLRNLYILFTVLFVVWILFFDQHNLFSQYRLTKELRKYEAQKAYYLDQIEKDRLAMEELVSDRASLERFGREEYLMKRDNEDIFLIVPRVDSDD